MSVYVMAVAPVSITDSTETVLNGIAALIYEAPPGVFVRVWLRFSEKLTGGPVEELWFKSLVEGGALNALFDEEDAKRPAKCLGRTGVALSSGLLEHRKEGKHIIITGSMSDLLEKYDSSLLARYHLLRMGESTGATLVPGQEPLFSPPGTGKVMVN